MIRVVVDPVKVFGIQEAFVLGLRHRLREVGFCSDHCSTLGDRRLEMQGVLQMRPPFDVEGDLSDDGGGSWAGKRNSEESSVSLPSLYI
jgi:hypothetical protein